MRDRGAHTGAPAWSTIRKVLVLAAVPVALVLLTAEYAGADTPGSGQVPFTVAGPVGVGAVLVGIGGLVIGFLRRRKLPNTRSAPMSAPIAPVASALTAPLERIVADERAA